MVCVCLFVSCTAHNIKISLTSALEVSYESLKTLHQTRVYIFDRFFENVYCLIYQETCNKTVIKDRTACILAAVPVSLCRSAWC